MTQHPTAQVPDCVPDLSASGGERRWAAEELEPAACALCGDRADLAPVIRRPDGLDVVECRNCRLAFIDPRPHPELIARLYDCGYFGGAGASVDAIGYEDYLSTEAASRIGMRRAMRERANVVGRFVSFTGRHLLELGCASGEFAAEARRAGAVVTATDISAPIIEVARSRHPGIEFLVASAEEIADTGRTFDIVCGFELVEHVTDPVGFFKALRRLTRPGGIAVLSTPNYDEGRAVDAERWLGFRISLEHLYFFSATSLDALARNAGLTPVAYFGAGSGLWTPAALESKRLARVKQALRALRLLWLVRAARAAIRSTPRYAIGTRGHSLVAVYRG